ncbi:MAG TPA: hypothetical protein V6C81_20885 [Planktothrix sp.]|jgi:tetratricopeptide (TPR) repeat protein
MHTTTPGSGGGAACRPEQYDSASAASSFAQLLSECATPKPRLTVERSRWGSLELCREALRKHDYTSAKKRYENLLKTSLVQSNSRTAAKAMCDLAHLHLLLGETAQSDALYKSAYKEWKAIVRQAHSTAMMDYIHCLLDYSKFLRQAGRLEDALILEARVEQINPSTMNPYFAISRADLLAARGQDSEAADYYEQALLDVTMKHDLDLQLRVLDKLIPLYVRLKELQLADSMEHRRKELRKQKSARFL